MSISFGIPPWDLKRVAIHYQERRRVYLMARHEARLHKRDEAIKAGAMNVEVFLPEF